MKRKNIINTSVTDEAKAIYDSLHPRTKGIFVSDAIVAHSRTATDPFTPEQQEWIRREIASFLNGH